MIRSTIDLIFMCMTLAMVTIAHAMQTSDMAPCAANVPHDVRTMESFLIVHVDCSNVLLEIPPAMLNRSILVYTEFSALSTGGSEYAPGSAVDSRPVRWMRVGNKVALLTGTMTTGPATRPRCRRGSRRFRSRT